MLLKNYTLIKFISYEISKGNTKKKIKNYMTSTSSKFYSHNSVYNLYVYNDKKREKKERKQESKVNRKKKK